MTSNAYFAVVLGLLGIVAITVAISVLILGPRNDYDNYDDDDDYDNYDDDDDYDDEYPDVSGGGVPYPNFALEPKVAVKVPHPGDYDTGDISYADMMLRLTRPILYSQEWYDITRRDFSRWAVTQYREIATFKRESGIAA